MKGKTNTQKETETIGGNTLQLMKELVGIKDPILKEKYLKQIRESHNNMLKSFGNEILEAITTKEITSEQAKEYFKDLKEK